MRFSDDFVREVVNRTDLVQLMEERGVSLYAARVAPSKPAVLSILKRPHPSTSIPSVASSTVLAAEPAVMPFVF